MSDALTFPLGGESTSSPPAGPRTCDPRGTPRQPEAGSQMTMIPPRSREAGGVGFTRQQSADFSLRPGGDGTAGSGSGSVDSDRYYPYHRPLGDARSHSARRQASSSPSSSSSSSWDRFNGSVQSSFSEPQTDPVEPACFLSHGYPLYSASGALQHVSSRQYPHVDQYNSSKFPLQSVSASSHLESSAESVFPKPIYSYSLLIFLALRNSAAGRLPVSEIYGFMTQHFPYFKSAPDGWKNSVRHNLSLNKCFQKVEGRQQSAPRKGCLWALNPAKVDKMQEELHKWRRKDPGSVRRSMASPEDMDRLLGERPTKLRPLPSFATPALLSRVASVFGPASSCTPPQHRPPPSRRPQYAHAQPPQPCYPPPPAAPPFGPYSACGQQRPPGTFHGGFHAAGAQDFLLEGDGGYEVDALDLSLTDLQLPGNLWDGLVFDPTSDPPERRHQPGVPRVTSPEGRRSEGTDGGDEDEDVFDRHACLSGLHPAVCSGAESLAGFLTSCSTSISLM